MKNDSKTIRSECPVAIGLDFYGDKWTLLLIRDLLKGPKKFKDLEKCPEHIPTNILSSRLKKMIEHEVIKKTLYQEKPKRYEYVLLEKGRDMIPVLQSMARWAIKHVDGCGTPSDDFWALTP